jgi:hypothetical protein
MAGDGIDIRLGVDPAGVIEGADDAASALEKIDDALGDISKSGDKDLDKLEKSLKDIDQAALRTGDELDRNLGKKTRNATKEAEGGLKDFKEEANSTAKESAASFDGSAESIVDAFQEVAANAFEGFGPAGAVAGLALAAGIGLATSAFTQSQEEIAKTKERVENLGLAMIESGDTGRVSFDAISEELGKILAGSEDAAKSIGDIRNEAQKSGVAVEDLAMAYAGNEQAIEGVISELDVLLEAEKAARQEAADAGTEKLTGYDQEIRKLEDVRNNIVAQQEAIQEARRIEQEWLETGGQLLLNKEELISQVNEQYDQAAASAGEYIDAETGIADVQGFLDGMAKRQKAIEDYTAALTSNQFTPEQQKALNDMGFEAGSQFMQLYNQGTEAQKGELKTILTTAATDSSGAALDTIDNAFATADVSKIPADIDLTKANQTLEAWRPGQKQIDVLVKWKDSRTGQVIP